MGTFASTTESAEKAWEAARMRLPLFNEDRGLVGPVMRSAQRRTLVVWGLTMVLGLVLANAGAGQFWAGFGMGLFFPGSGFLYSGNPVLLVLTPVLFIASLLAWLLMGIFIAPVIVWLGTAILAGVLA